MGCITYREGDILVDPNAAAVQVQREVTITIVHEMSHQVASMPKRLPLQSSRHQQQIQCQYFMWMSVTLTRLQAF